MPQPIRLVLPDLFQDRLAKLTERAAHVDMVKQSASYISRFALGEEIQCPRR